MSRTDLTTDLVTSDSHRHGHLLRLLPVGPVRERRGSLWTAGEELDQETLLQITAMVDQARSAQFSVTRAVAEEAAVAMLRWRSGWC